MLERLRRWRRKASGVASGLSGMHTSLSVAEYIFGIPGNIEDAGTWRQWLSNVADLPWYMSIAIFICTIVLVLYASSGWWSRFFHFLPPSDGEIDKFKKLNYWATASFNILEFWKRQTPDLKKPEHRILQLEATLAARPRIG